MANDIGLKFILDAVNKTGTVFKEVQNSVEDVTVRLGEFSNVAQGALGVLTAYAGAKGLMGIVGAYEDANKQLVQARFFLKGMGDDVEGNLSVLQKWGSQVQDNMGISDEYAILVASRLAPRMRDLNKIQDYATTLLKGHRIGVLDAESASIMLMRAADGNTRAMTWLAYQLGITVHEFESMDSIMAKLKVRLEGLTGMLSPARIQWDRLKETMLDLLEVVGEPLARVFADLLGFITDTIKRFPILEEIIKVGSVVISGALLGLGASFAATKLGLGGLLTSLGLTAGFISGAAASILLFVYMLDWMQKQSKATKEILVSVFMGLASALAIIFAIFGGVFFLPFAIALSALAIATQMSIEGYEVSWKGFALFLKDTFMGIKLMIEEWWGGAMNFIKDKINDAYNWVVDKVNAIKRLWEEAKSAVAGVAGGIGGAVGGILGFRQFGGYIPETGPYMLHKGEYVVPAGGSGAISLTITGNTFLDENSAIKMGDLIVKVLQRNLRI